MIWALIVALLLSQAWGWWCWVNWREWENLAKEASEGWREAADGWAAAEDETAPEPRPPSGDGGFGAMESW